MHYTNKLAFEDPDLQDETAQNLIADVGGISPLGGYNHQKNFNQNQNNRQKPITVGKEEDLDTMWPSQKPPQVIAVEEDDSMAMMWPS